MRLNLIAVLVHKINKNTNKEIKFISIMSSLSYKYCVGKESKKRPLRGKMEF